MSFKISDGVAQARGSHSSPGVEVVGQVKLNDARTGNALIRGLKRSLRASNEIQEVESYG